MRKLTNWLDSYIEYVDNTEPPVLFKVWAGLSTVAAVLKRRCSLKIGMNETFSNMFIMLVGPSGTGKSRAIAPAKKLVTETGIKLAAQKGSTEGLIRDIKNSAEEVNNNGVLLLHSSLSIMASEFSVFLKHQNNDLVDLLCDLYDCEERWEYKPKGEDLRDDIIRPWLNIIGGITPTTFKSRLPPEAIGGGLSSRMICVYEEYPSKYIPIHFMTERELSLFEDLKHDLTDMLSMKGEFKLTESFVNLWTEWYIKARRNPPFSQVAFDGYNSRRPLHVLKMSMNLSACRTSEMIINGDDLTRAIQLLERTEKNMPKTFEGMGESRTAKVLVEVMKYVAIRGKTTYADLSQAFYNDANRDTLKNILYQLIDMKYLTFNSVDGSIEYLPEGKANETKNEGEST